MTVAVIDCNIAGGCGAGGGCAIVGKGAGENSFPKKFVSRIIVIQCFASGAPSTCPGLCFLYADRDETRVVRQGDGSLASSFLDKK